VSVPTLAPENQPALRHLQRYVEILFGPDDGEYDPLLAAHIETTLLDLVALVLAATRDAGDIAAMRGLRAARLQAVLVEIKLGFAEPSFSVHHVAARLGLSARYVQDLLHETGRSFSERVLDPSPGEGPRHARECEPARCPSEPDRLCLRLQSNRLFQSLLPPTLRRHAGYRAQIHV
jgi:hypothetical protein